MQAQDAVVADAGMSFPQVQSVPPAPPPDPSRAKVARGAFVLAALVPLAFVAWSKIFAGANPPFSPGGCAAFVCVLLGVGLVFEYPSLITDGAGEEASTMRVLCLAIVFSFCAMVVRTAWNTGAIPTLENEGNWVWLVTAALGGKALQRFAEMKERQGGSK